MDFVSPREKVAVFSTCAEAEQKTQNNDKHSNTYYVSFQKPARRPSSVFLSEGILYTMIHYNTLYSSYILYYAMLCYAILYYIILCYIILYYII